MNIWQYSIARTYAQLTAASEACPLKTGEAKLVESLKPIVEHYEATEMRPQTSKAKA